MNTPTPVDPTPWLDSLCGWFGFPREVFDNYRMFQSNPKEISIVAVDHEHPTKPEPMSSGLSFMRINMRYPKLSTSAAMLFGPTATKRLVRLNQSQMDLYLKRHNQTIDPAQCTACEGNGYVLVQHGPHTMGLALLLWSEDSNEHPTLQSLFPKAHSIKSDRSTFDAQGG